MIELMKKFSNAGFVLKGIDGTDKGDLFFFDGELPSHDVLAKVVGVKPYMVKSIGNANALHVSA